MGVTGEVPDDARARLEQERARLQGLREGVLQETSSDASQQDELGELSVADQHLADVATELFEREKNISLLETFEDELREIEAALARIEAGTYGSCERCRAPIGRARLEAVPHARFCVVHQNETDRMTRA